MHESTNNKIYNNSENKHHKRTEMTKQSKLMDSVVSYNTWLKTNPCIPTLT